MNVLFLQTTKTGSVARNITPYNTDDLALMALYQGMRASIGDSNIVYACGMLMDDKGLTYKREEYTRAPEPQEEDEPSEEE